MPLLTSKYIRNNDTFIFFFFAFLIFFPFAFLWFAGRPAGIPDVEGGNDLAIRHIGHFLLYLNNGRADSWDPMRDALNVLAGPHASQLYEYLFFGQSVRFQYPPTSLLPIELLSRLGLGGIRSLDIINIAVYGLNAAGVGVLAWLLFARSPAPDASGRTFGSSPLAKMAMVGLAVASSAVFYPLLRAIVLGQIQIWIDAIFTLAIIFWLVEKRVLAGVCIGLACSIKPQFALLIVWGLLWREYGFAIGAAACLAVLGLLSIGRYGLHNHLAYLDVLSFLSKHGESFFPNNSVNGILQSYFSPDDVYSWRRSSFAPYVPVVFIGTAVTSLLSLVAIVGPPMLLRNKSSASAEGLSFAAIVTVIGSPVAWEHHYGILLPIYLVALKSLLSGQSGSRNAMLLVMLWVSWILVADFIPQTLLLAHSPLRFVQATQFFGGLLLLAALFPGVVSRDRLPAKA